MNKTHFPGLDTLRLYAALCVIIYHGMGANFPLVLSGGIAVTLFFTLSGFLITSILLEEKTKTGTINVHRFWIRRALRILPLYYFILVICYIVLPSLNVLYMPERWTLPGMLVFGGPFFIAVKIGYLNNAAHLWSIGVEEMFYFIFPIFVKRYRIPIICAGIIVPLLIIHFLAYYGGGPVGADLSGMLRFDCMAIGALAAYVYHYQKPVLALMYHPAIWIASIIGVVLLNFHLSNVNDFEASVIFAVFILNLATNPRLHLLEPRILAWFGQRTYGIYMWHYPIMAIFLTVAPGIGWPLLTLSMITFTLTVAAVSYRYFEHPFLRLKDRWQPMRYPRQSSNTISA